MNEWVRNLLVDWAPFFIAAGAIWLGFIHAEMRRANRYLRELTFLAYKQMGGAPRDWVDPGK